MVVGGGLAGCEVAVWLARQGRQVSVVEMLEDVMTGKAPVPTQVKMMTRDLMARAGVSVHTSSRVETITRAGITLQRGTGEKKSLEADTVVLAMGMTPDTTLARDLENQALRVYVIGDCREPKNIMNAVWDGYEVARFL